MTGADRLKVTVCEAMIRLNGDDPIIPPTAIDWIGDALVSAIRAAYPPEVLALIDWLEAR